MFEKEIKRQIKLKVNLLESLECLYEKESENLAELRELFKSIKEPVEKTEKEEKEEKERNEFISLMDELEKSLEKNEAFQKAKKLFGFRIDPDEVVKSSGFSINPEKLNKKDKAEFFKSYGSY
jgi:hypothetical protein